MKRQCLCAIYGLLLIASLGAKPVKGEGVMIYSAHTDHLNWQVVNDGVMGGLSQSRWLSVPDQPTLFSGEISLQNNGGFASVRSSRIPKMGREVSGVRLRVRGDGRTYRFTLRTNRTGRGVNYQRAFPTAIGQLLEIDLRLDSFEARWRGRPVPTAPTLRASDIRSVGFLLADKKSGAFALEVMEIRTMGAEETPKGNARTMTSR